MAKIERTKNAGRNIIFGGFLKMYQIIVPFVMRTIMIYVLGPQYLGLSSLFTSVLQVLNLAELGVGSAMVYSMYRPIAEDDHAKICALMKLYRTYYRIIGLVIAVVGGALTPFIHKIISGSVPDGINIYFLYLLNLGVTVLSYWLFAYKNSILQAYQRNDVMSKVTIITYTLQFVFQVIVLWLLKSYYLYLIVKLVTQVINNIITAVWADRIYPQYKPEGDLSSDERRVINHKIRDLFTSKLGTVFGTSVDNVVISAYLGLTMIAIYQNYYYIMNAVVGMIVVIFTSCTAGIGNSLVTEQAEKNYNDFKKLAFLTIWICTIGVSCFACLYQPFMCVWVGEQYLLPDAMVVVMCVYFYMHILQMLSCIYKDAAGIWKQDRFRPLVSGTLNLILNLTFVRFWGIYAIVLSTICSYLTVSMPWVIHNLFENVFYRSSKEYVLELIKGAAISGFSGVVCYIVCFYIKLTGFFGIGVRLIVVLVISNVLFIVFRRRNEMFKPSLELMDRLTKHKFSRIIHIVEGLS